MKVGILGTGKVGATLGRSLQNKGHSIKYGTRDPSSEKVQALLGEQAGTEAAPNEDVVQWADAVILALPGAASKEQNDSYAAFLKGAKGKPVLDSTNTLLPPSFDSRVWTMGSGGEALQAAVGDQVPVFKVFNTIHYEYFKDPVGMIGPDVTMMYAGPTDHAEVVETIVRDVGFKPFRVGPIRYARNLEAVAELYIHLIVPPVATTDVKLSEPFAFQLRLKQ